MNRNTILCLLALLAGTGFTIASEWEQKEQIASFDKCFDFCVRKLRGALGTHDVQSITQYHALLHWLDDQVSMTLGDSQQELDARQRWQDATRWISIAAQEVAQTISLRTCVHFCVDKLIEAQKRQNVTQFGQYLDLLHWLRTQVGAPVANAVQLDALCRTWDRAVQPLRETVDSVEASIPAAETSPVATPAAATCSPVSAFSRVVRPVPLTPRDTSASSEISAEVRAALAGLTAIRAQIHRLRSMDKLIQAHHDALVIYASIIATDPHRTQAAQAYREISNYVSQCFNPTKEPATKRACTRR